MAKESITSSGLEAALSDVLDSISFEGEGIDQDLMAKVMAKMRSEMTAELGQVHEPSQIAYQGTAASANTPALLPLPPPIDGRPTVRVHFLRFDGAGPSANEPPPTYEANYFTDQTAGAFLDAFLLSQGCPLGGDARLDRGSPNEASPITRVQPLWTRMAEVMSLANSCNGVNRAGDGEDATPEVTIASSTASSPANSELVIPEMTVHWYPPPPESSGLRGTAGGGDANWVRIITTTRRSVFAPFDPALTTLDNLRRCTERECGVPVEWQRLFCGGALLSGPGVQVAYEAGVVAGMNLFLTARVEGLEYGGANAGMS
jgi:hypothetical protein